MISKTKTQAFLHAIAEEVLDEFRQDLSEKVIEHIVRTTNVPRWLYLEIQQLGFKDGVGVRRALVAILRTRAGHKKPYNFIPTAC